MLTFEKYRDEFKSLYPDYTEEQLEEIFELRVKWSSHVLLM